MLSSARDMQRADPDKEIVTMTERLTLPVLPLREVVLFPGVSTPIGAGRPATLRAIEAALKSDSHLIFAVAQRENVDTVTPGVLYTTGTIAKISQIQRGLGGVQLLLHGENRATALHYSENGRYLEAVVREVEDLPPLNPADPAFVGLHREARERAAELGQKTGLPEEVVRQVLEGVADAGRLADLVAGYLEIPPAERQGLLETLSVEDRLRRVLVHVQRQIGVLDAQEQIKSQVQEELGERQREMFLREQLKAIRKELGEEDEVVEVDELRKRFEALELPEAAKKEVERELQRLERADRASLEAQGSRTHVGAMPGRIIQGMKQAGAKNPVFLLDEVDKLGVSFQGDPAAALLEVLDPAQNDSFTDHYLGVPFDLSEVLFIATANFLQSIPGPLLGRPHALNMSGYTEREKLEIAKRYLLPRQLQETGLAPGQLTVSDAALSEIITSYTRETGVRQLEREIGKVARKVARKVAVGEVDRLAIDAPDVDDLIGRPKVHPERMAREDDLGVATGMYYTPVGGDIMFVEASVMRGKGELVLTGQLGDVMKESARAALTYAKSHADQLGIPEEALAETDVHIHVPAGAIPKDGPSAGVTMRSEEH